MNEERFNKMMEGIRQGAECLKGKREPSRLFKVTIQIPDVKSVRSKLGASQSEFAEIMGISKRTVQNWEQKLRVPSGPARVLLNIAAAYPEVLRKISKKKPESSLGAGS
jgi:putative transcriptional regulator